MLDFSIGDSLFAAWAIYSSGNLFPNVKTIKISMDESVPRMTEFVLSLISSAPTVMALENVTARSIADTTTILQAIGPMCRGLQALTVMLAPMNQEVQTIPHMIAVSIGSATSLRTIHLDLPIDDQSLILFATLPHLTDIQKIIYKGKIPLWSSVEHPFSSLRSLHIVCDNSSLVSTLLVSAVTTTFHSLTCGLYTPPQIADISSLTEILANTTNISRTIVSFSLILETYYLGPITATQSANSMDFENIVTPLWRRCSALQSLDMSTHFFQLNEDAIEVLLTEAPPELHSIWLLIPPRLSLPIFLRFLQRFGPDARCTLELENILDYLDIVKPLESSIRLEQIYVIGQVMELALAPVACLLLQVFPTLSVVRTGGGPEDDESIAMLNLLIANIATKRE
jgi:hypothetical protein